MAKFSFYRPAMDLNIKLLQLPDGNHLIIITSGLIDMESLGDIICRVVETTQPLLNCKVLIDFEAANLILGASDVSTLVGRFGVDAWPDDIRIALVSSPDSDRSGQLDVLRDSLCNLGLRVALFSNSREAVNWLVHGM
jgi:hypothetical protein